MARIQNSVELNPPIGRVGQVINSTPREIASYEAKAVVGFGVPVMASADGISAGVGQTGGNLTDFLGVTVEDRSRLAEQYSAGDIAAVMSKGEIVVRVAEAVAIGAPVAVTIATNGWGTGTGSAAKPRIPRARWKTAAANGGLAILQLDTSKIG